jgi:hypothetical protein
MDSAKVLVRHSGFVDILVLGFKSDACFEHHVTHVS